jgi:hypothetical protein
MIHDNATSIIDIIRKNTIIKIHTDEDIIHFFRKCNSEIRKEKLKKLRNC